MEKDLKFTVDSALLRELGEKLVETVHLALSELVKNSYDADASEVEVNFETDDNGNTQIVIKDNGIGMNFEEVQKYWMRIATTNKVEKNVSSVYGRFLTGAKGIGRFSCRRLGTKLTLITQGTRDGNICGKQKKIQRTKVVFPWTEFEAGEDVTSITCKGEQEDIPEGFTGTTLIIEGIVEHEWTTRGLNWLKRQLSVLAANRGAKREGFIEDPGFEVMLTAPDFEGGIRDIREDLINAGWGTLKAYINTKNQAVCELNALGIGRRVITSKVKFPNLNDVKFKIGIMVPNRDQMRDTSILSKANLSEIIPQWGGVHIRYRNFRVYPYGDDDWLYIDKDRGLRKASPKNELLVFAESLRGVDSSRALLNMLSMRNYIGSVDIGPKAIGFEMKANREGFIESKSIFELKEFVRFAIDWSTILRDFYLRQESKKIAQIAKEEFENVVDQEIPTRGIINAAVNYLESNVKTVSRNLPTKERIEIEQSWSKATNAIKTHSEAIQVELSHLRLVASTSSLLLIFSHEVKSLLGLIEQSKNSLNLIALTLEKKSQLKVENISTKFQNLKDRLTELLQLTSLIITDKNRSEPGPIALKPKLEHVEKIYELITHKYDIEINHSEVPNNIVIGHILEAELYSILINLLSNSIKAVIAGGRSRKINISASVQNGITKILIADSGVGISEERFKEVFIPFVSDPEGVLYENLNEKLNPEDNLIVGSGSGLGLGIVKEIVSHRGGNIRFKKPENNWSTTIEINLK